MIKTLKNQVKQLNCLKSFHITISIFVEFITCFDNIYTQPQRQSNFSSLSSPVWAIKLTSHLLQAYIHIHEHTTLYQSHRKIEIRHKIQFLSQTLNLVSADMFSHVHDHPMHSLHLFCCRPACCLFHHC